MFFEYIFIIKGLHYILKPKVEMHYKMSALMIKMWAPKYISLI